MLAIILYWLKCNGIIDKIFKHFYLYYRVFMNIARMMPIAIAGITFGYNDVLTKLILYIL